MYKKVISLMLAFMMLMPTVVFGVENTNESESEDVNKSEYVYDVNSVEGSLEEEAAVSSSEENEGNEEVIEEPVVLQPSIIKDAKVTASDVNSCKFEWNLDSVTSVKMHFIYGDVDKTINTKNTSYNLTGIPFGETVKAILTTDDEHEAIELTCKPSDYFTPVEVRNNVDKTFSKSNSGLSYYCSGIGIYTKAGTKVSSSYYSFDGVKEIKSSGIYTVNVKFKGKYEGYKPLSFALKVIPSKQTVGYNPIGTNETSFRFTARNSSELCDYIIAEISTKSDFSNPIVKKVKPKNTTDFSEFNITGLKINTLYYIRIKSQKNYNGKALYSEPTIIQLRTACKMPTYSWSQKDVKNIIALSKKNKAFTYTFNGHYNARSMYDFLGKIDDDYPQYMNRYYRETEFKDNKTIVRYTVNSKNMTKYTKATKAIDSIVKGAKKKKGVKAKVKYINKRMCATCRYDYDTYRRTKKYSTDAYTLYGCVVRHKAVCAGYAEAFHAIAVQCGIQDQYVHGKNHVWNKVKVGNKWLHCDITWNDCQKRNKTKYLLKKSHR